MKQQLEQLLRKQKKSTKQAELQLDDIREAIKQLEIEISTFEDRDQKVQKRRKSKKNFKK